MLLSDSPSDDENSNIDNDIPDQIGSTCESTDVYLS